MTENKWIFISSHFDDVVLSAGGLVWELTSRGARVEIWTICAGDPPAGRPLPEQARLMHEFWRIGDNVPYKRSLEDAACCQMLGAAAWRRHTIPDGIYRYLPGTNKPVVLSDDDLMHDPEPEESYLIAEIADFIRKNLPEGYEVAVPLAIGSHRDHILTRCGAEALGIPLWYYADYPYLVHSDHKLSDFVPENSRRFTRGISPKGVKVWQDAFACHRSQIPLLFADEEDMRSSIARYHQGGYGATLYQF
jgi:LmbE family N-acetylglucosaminyl deacetylase